MKTTNSITGRRPSGGILAVFALCILLAICVNVTVNLTALEHVTARIVALERRLLTRVDLTALEHLTARIDALERRLGTTSKSVQQQPNKNSLEGGPPITTDSKTPRIANKVANAPTQNEPPPPHHQTCATYGYPSAQTSFPRAPVKISPRPYCASLRENPATDVVCDNIWKDGHWEPSLTVSMILDLGWPLANRNLFIDVGGNVGYFTSLVASLGHEVISIEPFGKNQPILMSTVCANGFQGRVRSHKIALTESPDRDMCLWSPHDKINIGNARLVPYFEGAKDFDNDKKKTCQERIRTNTLDGLLFEDADGPRLLADEYPSSNSYRRRPQVMKMDIEGYETKALKGASRLLSENAPCVVYFEHQVVPIQTSGEKPTLIFELLEKAGYDIYNLDAVPRPGYVGDQSIKSTRKSGPSWGNVKAGEFRAVLKPDVHKGECEVASAEKLELGVKSWGTEWEKERASLEC